MLRCPGTNAISRAPSPTMRVIRWAGVVRTGIALLEWLRGRELNPQGQGYESRLEPFRPAFWLELRHEINDELKIIPQGVPPCIVPLVDGCLFGFPLYPAAKVVEN